MDQNDVAFLKRVTRNTPLQFFGQRTVKNDRSQFLKFFLPLLGFIKKKSTLGLDIVIIPNSTTAFIINALERKRYYLDTFSINSLKKKFYSFFIGVV